MYHSYFGKLGQLRFPKPEDYYRFLGYLAHADIKVVYEYNEDTGSWGNAGRICFYTSRVPRNWGKIAYREGRGDSMWYRTKAASKDSLQSVPFIVQYESRNNQVHFLAAKLIIFV